MKVKKKISYTFFPPFIGMNICDVFSMKENKTLEMETGSSMKKLMRLTKNFTP
jgi:hypothetical protein